MWPKEFVEELHRRFETEAAPWIEDRTVEIFLVVEGGNPVPQGTGVLIQVADRGFVLTAGHTLDGWGTVRFILLLGEDGGQVVDLTRCPAEVTRNKEELDFAIIPLDSASHELVLRAKRFVRLSEVDISGENPINGIHAFFGYPVELVHRDYPQVLSFAIFYPTILSNDAELDGRVSIALQLDIQHEDEDGSLVRLPSLKGVSGCGIWRLHRQGDDPREWNVDRIALVGIEHTVVKQIVKGVRINQVIRGMESRYPDLAPSIRLFRNI